LAGIYIHIPFCAQKCHYCDFYSLASLKYRDKVIESIIKEIEFRKDFLGDAIVNTIYFGGGTPSILTISEIKTIIDQLYTNYSIAEDPEITLEANPEDLNSEFLRDLKCIGINRLSIGIQTTFDKYLEFMNRRHSAGQGLKSIREAKKAGFTNISIDLIYGIPGLTMDEWKQSIDEILQLGIQHISAYHLTIEEKTAFGVFKKRGKLKEIEEDSSFQQFELLIKKLNEKQFIHYEISNFARENFYSKHNSNYWKQVPYLGIGPSAHSFKKGIRTWNFSSIKPYIEALNENKLPFEQESLTKTDQYNDYVITTLRTIWGIDINYIEKEFGEEYLQHLLKNAEYYVNKDYLVMKEKKLTLTSQGKFISDAIISDLFYLNS